MPKEDIRMTDAEIDQFLRTQAMAIIAAGTGPGAPSGAVGRLHYDAGAVAFSLPDDDPVVADLAADDRVCCVVEQYPTYYEIMGVMLHGHATRRDASAPGMAVFDLAVDKVLSFDFAKLAGNAGRG